MSIDIFELFNPTFDSIFEINKVTGISEVEAGKEIKEESNIVKDEFWENNYKEAYK